MLVVRDIDSRDWAFRRGTSLSRSAIELLIL